MCRFCGRHRRPAEARVRVTSALYSALPVAKLVRRGNNSFFVGVNHGVRGVRVSRVASCCNTDRGRGVLRFVGRRVDGTFSFSTDSHRWGKSDGVLYVDGGCRRSGGVRADSLEDLDMTVARFISLPVAMRGGGRQEVVLF